MKALIVGAALAVGAALSLTPGKADASCVGVCNMAYRQCLSSGSPEDQCETKLEMCMERCEGQPGTADAQRTQLHIKDQNGQEILIGQTRPVSLLPLESKT